MSFTEIRVGDIERELASRWLGAAPQEEISPSRSCALNLIVCLDDAAARDLVSSTVGRLADTHPIRAITVLVDQEAADETVRAWVGVGCAPTESGAAVCSEEIVLSGHPSAAGRLASAARGLLSPDMPVYVWWRGGPPGADRLFAELSPYADKLIVDSIQFGDGASALDTLRGLVEPRGAALGIADLNWVRTAPWRTAIATCFDDREVREMLSGIDLCAIRYCAPALPDVRPSARALLLAGWLANRAPGLSGRIRINPLEAQRVGLGRVVTVTLASSRSGAKLALTRELDPLRIAATMRSATADVIRSWSFPTGTLSEAELLHYCLDAPPRGDPLFASALAAR